MAAADPASATENTPEEPARPGTSGTEMLLVNNRRRASTRYKDAQKKERAYVTKKRSTAARANYAAAKSHYRQGLHHNWAGLKLTWRVIASVPYLFRDKNAALKKEAEEKRKLRAAEKQRKAEAKQAREKELLEQAKAAKADADAATVADE